jgi:hypothetical protein
MMESLRNIKFTRSRIIVAVIVFLFICCLLCLVGGSVYNVAFGPAPTATGGEGLLAGTLVPTFTPTLPEINIPTWTPTNTPTPILPTSTPIPIYTPTPTDTPPPTDTPTPPPPTHTPSRPAAPGATSRAPAPSALSAEELAYANTFISQAKQWEDSHERSMKLLSVTKPYDFDWKTQFDAEMNTWQRLIGEGQALQAPPRFQEFNKAYQKAIDLYLQAKTHIIQGVDDIQNRYDLQEFNLGMDDMLAAQKSIHQLNDEMKAFRGTP